MTQDIRCPKCGKKIAEALEGTLRFSCRGCQSVFTVARLAGKSFVLKNGVMKEVALT
jgi:phage FluMu protein Com